MTRKMRTQEGNEPETGAQPLAVGGGNIRSPITSMEMAMEQLWTTEMFQEAVPYPLEVSEEVLKKALEAKLGFRIEAGEEGTLPGGAPEKAAAQPTGLEPAATAGGYDYPGPYTLHEVGDPGMCCNYTAYPLCTIGKLFFVQHGTRYVASAASIGNYAIWTAGHCVHAGDSKPDGWSTNLVFVPAYKDNNAPLGQWPASYLLTRTVWYNNGNPNGLCEDMGGAILHPQGGKKISETVGWLGFAWNQSRYQHWHSLGYPAASPFNGQRMWCTEASFAYLESDLSCQLKPHAIGCNMTGGCSGGPWVMKFGNGNYLNGNNSYRYNSKPEEMKSPYFGNEAKDLFDQLIKSTP